MKISVIVPYKDEAKYLGRCVDSLCSQKGNFEFLLVNDGSKDESPEIAATYADARIVLLDNEYKAGVSGARNTGLKHATGDWITFLDADDTMRPDAFDIFEKAVKSDNGESNVYQFNHYRYYASIDKLALKYTNPARVFELPELPLFWCMVWNKLFRAEILKGIRFDDGMQFGEDEIFNLKVVAKEGRINCVKGITETRHFDNQNRLSKIKTEKDVLRLNDALTKAVKKSDDPKFREAVCLRLSEHWSHLFKDYLT